MDQLSRSRGYPCQTVPCACHSDLIHFSICDSLVDHLEGQALGAGMGERCESRESLRYVGSYSRQTQADDKFRVGDYHCHCFRARCLCVAGS